MTPDFAPSCRAHMPVQFTTYSHSMSPYGVSTPVTTPRLWVTPVTATPSRMVAPCMRAPLASAIVTSTGLALPSSFT